MTNLHRITKLNFLIMKKIVSSISTLVISITICLLFVCTPAANARKSQGFVYDKSKDKETVFLYDSVSRVLTPHLKYEFSYTENNQLKSKKAYRWSTSIQQWIPYYLFTMTTAGEFQVHEFARWNNKKNDFSLDKQKSIFHKEAGTDNVNYISFRWNARNDKWEVIDGDRFENDIALLINSSTKLQ